MGDGHRRQNWAQRLFIQHLAVFVVVIPMVVVADLFAAGPLFAHWAVLGWGAALLIHAFFVFSTRHGVAPDVDEDVSRAA